MSQTPERLQKAIERNLAELSNFVLKRRACNALLDLGSSHSLDFFRVSAHALKNDLIAHAIRVFDRHKDAASFWYVQRQLLAEFSTEAEAAGISLANIEIVANKLVHIRDKTHFHIDKTAVEKPSDVWETAGISGNEFIALTEGAHEVLRRVCFRRTGIDHAIPNYHGEDVAKIIRAYAAAHPEAAISL